MAQSSYETTTYSTFYDNSGASLDTVTCGSTLEAQGYTTFGSLPGFPLIGGFSNITGPESSECGMCAVLGYAGGFVTVMFIDSAENGLVLSEVAMAQLVGNVTEYPIIDARILEWELCN